MGLRVLHVSQSEGYGIGKYLEELTEAQRALGWEVTAATPSPAGDGWVRWAATRDPGPRALVEAAALARIVRRVNPDVVHLHSSKAGLAGRLAVRGRRPTIFQPHAWSFFASSAALRWERFGARWADVVLCVSEGERAEGEAAGIKPKQWRVVSNAVDTDRFAPGDSAAARAAVGLDGDGPVAVCVARLAVAQKGQDVLVKAWPAVAREVPGARLVLVGEGPDRAMLEAQAGQSVVFAGGADPAVMPDWYRAADVIVQPSRYEGLALSVLEAMACGRPVVAGAAVGMAEAIGNGGAVVPVGDAQALAAALIERLRDPARATAEGERARERAVAHYGMGQWREAMAALTQEVAARR